MREGGGGDVVPDDPRPNDRGGGEASEGSSPTTPGRGAAAGGIFEPAKPAICWQNVSLPSADLEAGFTLNRLEMSRVLKSIYRWKNEANSRRGKGKLGRK